jgi:uncharacterized protein with HEPN domain
MQRDRLLVAEMVEACRRVMALAAEIADRGEDETLLEALLWNFTVLGEAASQVSDALKRETGHIGWANPVRLRNRLVHGYWSIDHQVLLVTARTDVPPLLDQLNRIERTLGD